MAAPGDSTVYLTKNDLIAINERIRGTASAGQINESGLATAVEGPRFVFGGFRLSWPEKVVKVLLGLAQHHPFVDGNKRTAVEAVRTMYLRNGAQPPGTDELQEWANEAFDVGANRAREAALAMRVGSWTIPDGQTPYSPADDYAQDTDSEDSSEDTTSPDESKSPEDPFGPEEPGEQLGPDPTPEAFEPAEGR